LPFIVAINCNETESAAKINTADGAGLNLSRTKQGDRAGSPWPMCAAVIEGLHRLTARKTGFLVKEL
jgi:hypothetical protein